MHNTHTHKLMIYNAEASEIGTCESSMKLSEIFERIQDHKFVLTK